MDEKTQLEQELEVHERSRTPLGIIIIVILLTAGLIASGYYNYSLKLRLNESIEKQESLKQVWQENKLQLLKKIKKLETNP
ncbi:MAG: hypothetical protein ISR96_07970 [Nitrospira sp.]|nr:hypothetical protein [Nitrospira sp.]